MHPTNYLLRRVVCSLIGVRYWFYRSCILSFSSIDLVSVLTFESRSAFMAFSYLIYWLNYWFSLLYRYLS
jgi:hypothetical protein